MRKVLLKIVPLYYQVIRKRKERSFKPPTTLKTQKILSQAQFPLWKAIHRIEGIKKIELSSPTSIAKLKEQGPIQIRKRSSIINKPQTIVKKKVEESSRILIKTSVSPYIPIKKSSSFFKSQLYKPVKLYSEKKLTLIKIKGKKVKEQVPLNTLLPRPFIKGTLVESIKQKISPRPLPSKFTIIESGGEAGSTVTGLKVDFFDLFLRIEGEDSSRVALEPDGPAILVLATKEGEEYGQAVQLICQEILRERGKLDEVGAPVISEREIEETLIPERLSNKAWLIQGIKSKTEKEKLVRLCRSLLQSKSPGYLIFEVPQKGAKDFYKKLEERFRPRSNLYLLKLRDLSLEEKELIISLTWGLGEQLNLFEYFTSQGKVPSFDDLFLWAERKYSNRIKKIRESNNRLYEEVTKPDPETEESELHYKIKMFLVYYYATNKGLTSKEQIEEKIKTEDMNVIPEIRPDIYLEDEKVAIEIETLYESGFLALKRIRLEKLPKYQKANQPVRFVLPGLMFLRHLELMKDLKRYRPDMDFDFYTTALYEDRLLTIQDVETILRNLIIKH